jgi:hypothetical protein
MDSGTGNPPNYTVQSSPVVVDPLSSTNHIFSFPSRPALRITTEFDSESAIFFHKISCKILDSLAKFKLTFHNNSKGDVSEPQISFVSKHLSLHYDLEDHSALVNSTIHFGPKLKLTGVHDVKAQQGEVTMVANIADPGYALQLSTPLPSTGLVCCFGLFIFFASIIISITFNSMPSLCSQKQPSNFL